MAAKIAGCDPIIAVDVHEARLALARELGATHTINHTGRTDVVAEIRKITGDGVRFSLETSAQPAVFREAVEALMPAGTCVLLGSARAGTEVSFEMPFLQFGRMVRGVIQGDSVPQEFIPRLVDFLMQGTDAGRPHDHVLRSRRHQPRGARVDRRHHDQAGAAHAAQSMIPKKPAGWAPVFRKRSCSNKKRLIAPVRRVEPGTSPSLFSAPPPPPEGQGALGTRPRDPARPPAGARGVRGGEGGGPGPGAAPGGGGGGDSFGVPGLSHRPRPPKSQGHRRDGDARPTPRNYKGYNFGFKLILGWHNYRLHFFLKLLGLRLCFCPHAGGARASRRAGDIMGRKYFGTDGIRGRANGVITPELALKVGQAAGLVFRRGDHRHRVVIGKDTRLSGYMIETALVAGFTSVGMDVLLLGPMPTPAVAMLTRSMRADLGVMISASHNPYDDNGIKLFGPDGYKLSDEVELQIEQLIDGDMSKKLAKSAALGRAKRIDGVHDRYIEFAKRTLPKNLSLDGLRVVVDCAHGAAYRVAPEALWELGAEVISIGVEPGRLQHQQGLRLDRARSALAAKVREMRADIGIALDGDADRVVIVDERGRVVDGDQLLAVIAESWKEDGRLAKPGVVATVMSNLGLERYLASGS